MILIQIIFLIAVVFAEQPNIYHNDFNNQRYDPKPQDIESVSPSSLRMTLEPDNDVELSHQMIARRGSLTYQYEEEEKNDGYYDGSLVDTIPGKAGKDYPAYTSVPKTSFSCKGRMPSGYFADVETNCQVFHVCLEGGHKISFLCPNGSIFNQKVSVCDWWYDVDCGASYETFEANRDIQRNQIFDDPNFQYQHFVVEDTPYYDLNLASSGGNQHPKYEDKNNDDFEGKNAEQKVAQNDSDDKIIKQQDKAMKKIVNKNKNLSKFVSTTPMNIKNHDYQ